MVAFILLLLDEYCIKNSPNSEEYHDDETDVNSTLLSSSNLNYKQSMQIISSLLMIMNDIV